MVKKIIDDFHRVILYRLAKNRGGFDSEYFNINRARLYIVDGRNNFFDIVKNSSFSNTSHLVELVRVHFGSRPVSWYEGALTRLK